MLIAETDIVVPNWKLLEYLSPVEWESIMAYFHNGRIYSNENEQSTKFKNKQNSSMMLEVRIVALHAGG